MGGKLPGNWRIFIWSSSYVITDNQKYTHRKKVIEKYATKKQLLINKKIKWMKIDFTYGRKFPGGIFLGGIFLRTLEVPVEFIEHRTLLPKICKATCKRYFILKKRILQKDIFLVLLFV